MTPHDPSDPVAGSLRVCVLVRDVDALGGMERQALLLARALARRGAAVRLLTCPEAGPGRGGPLRELRDGVRIVRLPAAALEPLGGLGLAARVAAREPIDVVYAVQLMMGSIGARLARLLGAPLVWKPSGGGASGDAAALRALPPADRDAVRAEVASAARVVCVSGQLQDEWAAEGVAPDRLARIPNGVDLEASASATPIRPAGDAPTVLYAGRLSPEKGADLLLRAFARVAAARPGARLLLAGDGPARPGLEALMAELGLAGAVRLLGRRDDVPGLLRGATVVALPSRHEGLSNVLLEALAAGAPVVATAIPSVVEALGAERRPGDEAALLVPPDDPIALAAALDRALGDPALRARLGAAGQARARATWSIDAVAAAYLALFADLPRPAPRGPVGLTARWLRARAADVGRRARRMGRRPPA